VSEFPRGFTSRALAFHAIAMMLPMRQCYGGKMGEAFRVAGSSAAEFTTPKRLMFFKECRSEQLKHQPDLIICFTLPLRSLSHI
jgi:hypothetical protein